MIKRLEKITKIINELNLDALFISKQANVSYLTNFNGLSPNEREAFLLLTKNSSFLLTFPTLFGMYKKDKNIDVVNIPHRVGLTNWLAKFFRREKIKRVGFEKTDVTVAELDKLKRKIAFVSWKETENIVENLRLYKDKQEIDYIKQACRVVDRAFIFLLQHIKPGQTERQIALDLEYFIKRQADDVAFSPIVAFGQNAAIPHYLPSTSQRLKTDSLILFDFGARVNNYCSDITRVVFFGKPDMKFIKIYDTVLKTQEMTIQQLKKLSSGASSVKASILDKFAKEFIKSSGFPEYSHGLGHGVGIEVHESPRLRIDSKDILSPNMTFTIEPAIYIEGWGGVRIEDLVLLKEDGVEILTKSPKEISIIQNRVIK